MAITDTSYEIKLSLKAINGWKAFGCFELGVQKEQASLTFESLTGHTEPHETALRLELYEHAASGSQMLAQKSCTLDVLSENVRIITRDAFKYVNLES